MHVEKIKIIELKFGIESEQHKISQETQAKIRELVDQKLQEKIALDDSLQICYNKLYSNSMNNEYTSSNEMLQISKNNNLSSLILKLQMIINRRGVWKLKKKKIGNISHYILTPKS